MSKYKSVIAAVLLLGLVLSACGQGSAPAEPTAAPEPTLSPQQVTYAQARAAYESGDYTGAQALFESLGVYEDSAALASELDEIIELEARYAAALEAFEARDMITAYKAFAALGDYRDSAELYAQAAASPAISQALAAVDAEVGDVVIFGEYEQDNDLENGPEPLEWIVLDKEEDRVFLLTKYGVDAEPFDPRQNTKVTWEESHLRNWLNSVFLDAAFSPDHQALIPETLVINEDNAPFHIDAGNDTVDRVYLLSMQEAAEYFPVRTDNWTVATDYAKAQGAWSNWHENNREYGNCWWWTRSPGNGQRFAVIVESDGNIKIQGDYIFRPYGSDRPVIWVDVSALRGEE